MAEHGFEIDWSELPTPEDDGAASHLTGRAMPALRLRATDGTDVALDGLRGVSVLYLYPMTGTPGVALPEGWNEIPGARGCTPQSCAYRDRFAELQAAGADHVYGISTQSPDDQVAAAERLHLPFALLSDADLALAHALKLPLFETSAGPHHKRMTLILRDGVIAEVFYPVFPPDADAGRVMDWLATP
ncbi:peroxiredoxin [Dinoroseobacter sp. S124A]|uniref:peroxiredoxin n=1 Tax=Dinoroseobacter sp. S124A TaxID=3415128 RepID=UPI003C7D295B